MTGVLRDLRRRLTALRRRAADDRGSLPMLMLVVLVGVGLAGVLVPMVVMQARSAVHTDQRVQSLHAAEAGVDAMLGRVRAASLDGGVTGRASKLPCYPSTARLLGTVVDTGATYSTTISYFTSDPRRKLTAGNILPTALTCTAGLGPLDLTGLPKVPTFALIDSTGTSSSGGQTVTRQLQTTYVFSTTNANIVGGHVKLDSTGNICLDAGLSPAAGTAVVATACSNPITAGQTFFYRSDLSLQLPTTVTGTDNGLCIDVPLPHTGGTVVRLQPCAALGSSPPEQQWSINAARQFVGTSAASNLDGYCLTVPSTTSSAVTLAGCPGSYSTTASWVPDPGIGAGAAGATNTQLVNFNQFGRCADVTNQTAPTNSSNPFMILYPCKQNPNPANVDWNQKFAWNPLTQQFVTTSGGTNYCLTAPSAPSVYVTVVKCNPGNGNPAQRWTQYGVAAADQANASQYPMDKRYTVVDTNGLCLSITAPDVSIGAANLSAFYRLTDEQCDGSTRQKWNADPNSPPSALQDTNESTLQDSSLTGG